MRKVTIIGAGPGNPDLLSRAALDAIDIADVVIGAFGRARSLELADAIQNKYPMKTTIIGDCMKPAKAGSAIREGFYAAMALK